MGRIDDKKLARDCKEISRMSETQKAFIAGFWSAKRFGLQADGRTISSSFVWKSADIVNKIAKLCHGTVTIGEGLSFSERFAFNNRPAVFTDARAPRIRLTVRGRYAQATIRAIYPYLSREQQIIFRSLLKLKFKDRLECCSMVPHYKKDLPRWPCGKIINK
jgi:hypothetical protein